MKNIKKRLLALTVLTMALLLSLSTAPAQAFAGSEVYASASYGSTQLAQYAEQVAILVNRQRVAQGVAPLKFSDNLSEVANVRAAEIETQFSHTRPNGESCFTAIDDAGISYSYAGENIAYGQKTPAAVMNAWMNSTGHKNNILSQYPNYIGVGVTYTNGRYYWVQLFAYSSELDGSVPYDSETAAKITAQPKNFVGRDGDTATFSVKASGTGLTYQWQLSDDAGKTWRNSSVTTASYAGKLTAANNGRYVRCVVTDKDGNKATSNAASMTISTIKFTTNPVDCTAKLGAKVSFTAKAAGTGLTYRWQLSDDGKTWRNSSVTGATYSVTLTTANNGRYVRCVATDKYGTTGTSKAAVMKSNTLQIITNPVDSTVNLGEKASFSFRVVGTGLTYQWQLSDDGKTWRNSSEKSATYATTLTTANSGRYVRCVVTDKYGNKGTTKSARMNTFAVQITAQPVDYVTTTGNKVKFTVKAVGAGLTYQWQLSDDAGKTWRNSSNKTDTYSVMLTDANIGRYVRCVVTDKAGNRAVSNAAVMKSSSLRIITQPSNVVTRAGGLVQMKVQASGSSLKYQWQLSDDEGRTWRNSSVATAVYTTTLTKTNNGRYVRCIVTDYFGQQLISEAASMKAA